MINKREKRQRIHRKIRMKVFGTHEKPRLCVFRSGKHVYAQLIDDEKGKVLASASDIKMKASKGNKVAHAKEVGRMIAKSALVHKLEKIVFDRSGFVFHGRVKAVAEGAREGGLTF